MTRTVTTRAGWQTALFATGLGLLHVPAHADCRRFLTGFGTHAPGDWLAEDLGPRSLDWGKTHQGSIKFGTHISVNDGLLCVNEAGIASHPSYSNDAVWCYDENLAEMRIRNDGPKIVSLPYMDLVAVGNGSNVWATKGRTLHLAVNWADDPYSSTEVATFPTSLQVQSGATVSLGTIQSIKIISYPGGPQPFDLSGTGQLTYIDVPTILTSNGYVFGLMKRETFPSHTVQDSAEWVHMAGTAERPVLEIATSWHNGETTLMLLYERAHCDGATGLYLTVCEARQPGSEPMQGAIFRMSDFSISEPWRLQIPRYLNEISQPIPGFVSPGWDHSIADFDLPNGKRRYAFGGQGFISQSSAGENFWVEDMTQYRTTFWDESPFWGALPHFSGGAPASGRPIDDPPWILEEIAEDEANNPLVFDHIERQFLGHWCARNPYEILSDDYSEGGINYPETWGGQEGFDVIAGSHGLLGDPSHGPVRALYSSTNRLYPLFFRPGFRTLSNEAPELRRKVTGVWDSEGPLEVEPGRARLVGVSSFGTPTYDVGTGWQEIPSRPIATYRLPVINNAFVFDAYVPAGSEWAGQIQMTAEVAAAGIWNTWLGQVDLSNLPREEWTEVTIPIAGEVQAALNGDFPNADIRTFANTNLGGVLIRDLRVAAHVEGTQPRGPHVPRLEEVRTNHFLSMESMGDWAGTNTSHGIVRVSDGDFSLRIDSGGWSEIESRTFSTAELPLVSDTMTVDVFVPSPLPAPYWVGDIQAYLSCPSQGLNHHWLGRASLDYLFPGEWNTVPLSLSELAQQVLTSGAQDCALKFALNTASTGMASVFHLDRIGFL